MERRLRSSSRLKAKRHQPLSDDESESLGTTPEIDLVFADDSKQNRATRDGMGPLIAVGGFSVPAFLARDLSDHIDSICHRYAFPPNAEFKWSPGRELWMRAGLVGERRKDFYLEVIGALTECEAVALVVIADANYRAATGASSAEEDVSTMYLERVQHVSHSHGSRSLVIVDRPGGGRRDEDAFLGDCLETIERGTKYVQHRHILHNVLSTPSHLSRLIQAADVIIGCSLAYVAGDQVFAPPIFESIRPLLYRDGSRIGGYGFKLHPAFRYANLYHWLLGDDTFWRFNMGTPLPIPTRPFSLSADIF